MSGDSQPVPASLGVNLLAAARVHEKFRPLPASSGSALIDESALAGGFRYGEITSIAGTSGTGKSLITYHAAASHLLTDEGGEVAVIDTTGSFSPLRMRDVLVFRLEARLQRGDYQLLKKAGTRDDLVEQATVMLDRVKVMRTFDFAGMVEAVSEVRELKERLPVKAGTVEAAVTEKMDEVRDSEEEPDEDHLRPLQLASDGGQGVDKTIGMIVIDTITNVTNSVMSKSQVQGQALLTSFMRSFYHLTAHHHICSIIVNAVVGFDPMKSTKHQRRPDEHISVFSSTLGKPALGKSFANLIDTSVLITTIPRKSKDATIAFGSNPDSQFVKALVLEVVKDRCGAREGRWAAFEIIANVKLVPCSG